MYATEILIGMTFIRIILPIAVLLAVGEWANRHAWPES